ncbi:unnamed protein product [Caenorhabditis angaria]|uniref:Delta(3),Delta(2)-enoyl-CoA isomerase n=1 Tax=Caenorhabditis angaria TaxID=860376 RepID=A0A9P1IFV6_9PELO|nr:unnamed protein product [Caenorhabditis angaria]
MLRNITKQLSKTCIGAPTNYRFFSSESFDVAQKNLKKLSEEPDNSVKLQLYALFKQSTSGDVQGNRPGMMDFVGRAKYDAWKALAGKTKEQAQDDYAKLVNSLLSEDQKVAQSSSATLEGLKPVQGLEVTKEGKIFKITLNRPQKFNAITPDMYNGIKDALIASNADKTTSVTVLSANGAYFSAGNDLTNFKKAASGDPKIIKEMAEDAKILLKNFVDSFVTHEKPLIGLIQGPAVGISVTVLGMFDYILASDKATFHTPFAPLGQSPEGASSYTFPLIMGPLRASELLLVCKKITAAKAHEYGLVNEVVADSEFSATAAKIVEGFSTLPPESLRVNKTLLRHLHRENLLKTNEHECEVLAQRWQSKECHQAIAAFLTRSKK